VLGEALAASNRATRFSALYTPVTAMLASLAVAALLWAGTRPTFEAFGISLGTLAAFLILLQRVFQPITALGEEWQTVQGALAGAERIFATLALAPENAGPTTTRPENSRERPPIHLVDVVFGYAPGQPVLHRTSLAVHASEHVALVGRTGAGKTSALQLLAGLYAPWAGTVRIAGRDPASLDESERRTLLGVVPQVVQLFSPSDSPGYLGFSPTIAPTRIAHYPMGEALIVSEGIDRDRAVDEAGNQLAVFGRRGARPLTRAEADKLYLRDGQVYTVTNTPSRQPVATSDSLVATIRRWLGW